MFLAKLKMWMTGNISNQSSCMIRDAFGKAVYCVVNDQRVYDWGSVALLLVISFLNTHMSYSSVFIMSDQ